MPPLPPLLGPSKAPSDRRADAVPPAGGAAPGGPRAVDDALDDTQLRGARAALAQGRRQAARSLLLHTGDDWDRRAHRLTVLAREPYAAAWARDWQLAEPDSADAAALLALALVQRALRGREAPGAAAEACQAAAALAPADPTPWLGLLLLARTLGPENEVLRLFAEVRGRHSEHHHAHHLLIARLAERPQGSRSDSHEVYDLAELAAAEAPADSPLAVLPVVAYAERYRVLAATGPAPADRAAPGHWLGPRARRVLNAAFDWWLEWERDDHPRRHVDLNHLAFAMHRAGRCAEAAVLFQRIGRHATAVPWSYPHRDPWTAFRAARAHVLGGQPSRARAQEAIEVITEL